MNTQLTPLERHGVLYYIEIHDEEWQTFRMVDLAGRHNPLSTLLQDYDWADEVLHARVGHDWYVSQFESPKEAVDWGDKAWSKVLVDWREWRDKGLTQHRNWWPDVYAEFCAAQHLEPDPAILAFNETYEQKRADLKMISAPA